MARKPAPKPLPRLTNAQLRRQNERLQLETAVLKQKSNLLRETIHNSLGGLATGITGMGAPGGPQSNLTSFNPSLEANLYAPATLLWMMLMYMYKTHGLIQTMIDMPVLDALRGGIEIRSDQIGLDLGILEDKIEEDGVLERIGDAFSWARLFGGGALIINSEAPSEQPLGDEVADGGQIELYDACRWELQCERRIPQNGQYGFYGKTLDASRVITILGRRAPYLIRAQLSDWGMSELERVIEDFNVFLRGREVVYAILDEAKLDVYSLDGFANQLATANGTALTTRRIQTMNQIKNFNNALILDAKDKYDQKTIPFGGLAEILRENRIGIASALRMPITKLFGMGATGFSSGQDDIENYNALVESEVRKPMRQIIRKVLKLYILNLFGEELDFDFDYKPLRVLSATDEENVKASKQTRFLALYDRLLADSQEIGEMIQHENLVPIALKAEQGLLDEHPQPEPVAVSPGGEEEGEEGDDGKKPESSEKKVAAEPPKAEEKPPKVAAPKSVKAEKAKMNMRHNRSRR
jgi:phage-related protein (TIGR01555 family)